MMMIFLKKGKLKKTKKKPKEAGLGCFLYSFLGFFGKLSADDGSMIIAL